MEDVKLHGTVSVNTQYTKKKHLKKWGEGNCDMNKVKLKTWMEEIFGFGRFSHITHILYYN